MPFYVARTLFNKLSHDYWTNFCQTWIVCTGTRRNCFLVHELGRDMQLPRAPRRRKILPTTSLSTWNFFRWPTTVRNVRTIYRWALELVIILLLLRFHSAIGVVTITRKTDAYRFWYLISCRFFLLTITQHIFREQSSLGCYRSMQQYLS